MAIWLQRRNARAASTRVAQPALRRYEGRMILVALKHSLRGLIAAVALAALAGCAGGTSSADLAPAAPQLAEPPPASQPQAAAPARGAPAGRNLQGAAPPAPARVAASPEEVKADCWMKYENDKKIKNIDERLKLVEKCVDETTRNQPPQRPER